MNLNTCLLSVHQDFLESEGLQGTHIDASKINDIDPERRFVNLFGEFSPLCGVQPQNGIPAVATLG